MFIRLNSFIQVMIVCNITQGCVIVLINVLRNVMKYTKYCDVQNIVMTGI